MAAFRFAGFLNSPPSQEVFWLAKFSSSLSLSEDALFSLDEISTYQNFSPMSHLISPRCPQPDRVHVCKTMIVIALFWLARRNGGGVLLIDLLGKGLTQRPSVGDRGSLWWAPGLHDNLYLDVEKLKRDVGWTDTGHMTLSGWQSLSFQSYIHRFMSECRRSVLKNIFMRLQAYMPCIS